MQHSIYISICATPWKYYAHLVIILVEIHIYKLTVIICFNRNANVNWCVKIKIVYNNYISKYTLSSGKLEVNLYRYRKLS